MSKEEYNAHVKHAMSRLSDDYAHLSRINVLYKTKEVCLFAIKLGYYSTVVEAIPTANVEWVRTQFELFCQGLDQSALDDEFILYKTDVDRLFAARKITSVDESFDMEGFLSIGELLNHYKAVDWDDFLWKKYEQVAEKEKNKNKK